MAAYRTPQVNVSGPEGEPQRLAGATVTHDLYATLGVAPALGRGFTAEEDSAGGEPVVVLSDGLWRRRYGGDRGLLGDMITVNARAHTRVPCAVDVGVESRS